MNEIKNLKNVFIQFHIYDFKEKLKLFSINSLPINLYRKIDKEYIPFISLLELRTRNIKIEPIALSPISGLYDPNNYNLFYSQSKYIKTIDELIEFLCKKIEKINVSLYPNKKRVTISFGKLEKEKTIVHNIRHITFKPFSTPYKIVLGKDIFIDSKNKIISYVITPITNEPLYISETHTCMVDCLLLLYPYQRHAFCFKTEEDMNIFVDYLHELSDIVPIFTWR